MNHHTGLDGADAASLRHAALRLCAQAIDHGNVDDLGAGILEPVAVRWPDLHPARTHGPRPSPPSAGFAATHFPPTALAGERKLEKARSRSSPWADERTGPGASAQVLGLPTWTPGQLSRRRTRGSLVGFAIMDTMRLHSDPHRWKREQTFHDLKPADIAKTLFSFAKVSPSLLVCTRRVGFESLHAGCICVDLHAVHLSLIRA